MSARMFRATVALVSLVALVSFALSASALAAVAGWAGVAGPLRWLVPVMVDAGALAFTLAGLAARARAERARLAWSTLAVLALVSVVANVTHALGTAVAPAVRLGVGVATVGVAPLVVLVAVHVLATVRATDVAPTTCDVAPAVAVSVAAVATVAAPVAPVAPATPAVAPAPDVHELDAHAAVPDDDGDVAGMAAMRDAGASLAAIALAYGVHASTVSRRLRAAGVAR